MAWPGVGALRRSALPSAITGRAHANIARWALNRNLIGQLCLSTHQFFFLCLAQILDQALQTQREALVADRARIDQFQWSSSTQTTCPTISLMGIEAAFHVGADPGIQRAVMASDEIQVPHG